MTFDQLVRTVAKQHGLSNEKTRKVIQSALLQAREAAKQGQCPVLPFVGRFVMTPVRSVGRKPDGTRWERPGRTKLAIRSSMERLQRITDFATLPAAATGT